MKASPIIGELISNNEQACNHVSEKSRLEKYIEPKKVLPISPIKILAGCQFQKIKPKSEPEII